MKNRLKDLPYRLEARFAQWALRLAGERLFSFPKSIRIESTNACNGRCVMCPRQWMRREIGVMDFGLFKEIVDQIPSGRRTIHLHNFGEPLLDPRIFDKIRYCKSNGFSTRIFSNINLLDEEMARALISSGLDDLKISIDAATKETYESLRRGLSYSTLIKNIELLMRLRRESGNVRPKVSVLFIDMETNHAQIPEFKELWKRRVDEIRITKLHNWRGGHQIGEAANGPNPQLPCLRLWQTATIYWNGDVVPCCMDYDGEIILGDVKKKGLKDILAGPILRDIKDKHVTGKIDEIPLCQACGLRR